MGNCVVSANNQLRMSALQVMTTLIAMASEKYIRWLKVTNWQSTDLEIKINKYMAIWSNSQTYIGWWHNMKCAPIDMIFLATILQLKVTKRELGALDGEKISYLFDAFGTGWTPLVDLMFFI